MTPRTLNPDRDTLFMVHSHIRFSLLRLRRSTPAASLLSAWEALYKLSQTMLEKERDFTEKIEEALANIETVDAELLDPAGTSVLNGVLKVVGNDRSDARYLHYTNGVAPSALTRPVLGPQIRTMRPWVESLKSSPEKELQELATPLKDALAAADVAMAAHVEAVRKESEFRATAHRLWFEKVNAERKTLHGELLKLAADPARRLSMGYADRFFLQRRPQRTRTETLASLTTEEAAAEEVLKTVRERKQALQARLEAERLAEAERDQKRAELREVERICSDAEQKAAALRKQLET